MKSAARESYKGFTMAEVMVVTVVLGLFFTGAYTLFFGGQRVAGKAAWLQNTTSDLRKAEQVITKAIQSTSYPSTLLPAKLVDGGGTSSSPGPNSSQFYIRIPNGFGKKTAAQLFGSNNGLVLAAAQCTPEKQQFGAPMDQPGSITWAIVRMEQSPDRPDQGTLIYEEHTGRYTTTSPDYAAAFSSTPTSNPLSFRAVLVRNVDSVETSGTAGHAPSKVTVTISAAYPRETGVSRQGTSAAVPNVGTIVSP